MKTDALPPAVPAPRESWQSWLARPGRETAVVTAFFLAVTLALFAPVLFGHGDRILSAEDADLQRQFIHWRAFGFGELARGHLPLWNPHIYGGTQYFGGFQAALLYPPNWLYLCLPLPRAVNVGIALHVFLAGLFMYGWVRFRGLHTLAAVLAGILFMFSGAYFYHVFAGHLPNLCTMVWGPLVFLAIDGWFARRTVGWLLFGGGVLALQILAGHPQYVFYTGVAAALYCAARLWREPRRWQAALGLAAVPVVGVALSAVQLFEGMHAAAESLRGKGTSAAFAGSFSFPPENFLLLLTPTLFGDPAGARYWGRLLLWEMCPFVGVGGIVLTLYALTTVRRREVWEYAGLAAVLFLIALGKYTPLFNVLYHYAPGFNKFRGWSKFIYPATLFVVMLAAVGFDALLRRGTVPRALVLSLLGAAVVVAGAAVWADGASQSDAAGGPQPWRDWISAAVYSDDSVNFWQAGTLLQPENVRRAAQTAAYALFLAAGTLGAFALAFQCARRWQGALLAVPVVALVESLAFAAPTLVTFEYAPERRPQVAEYLETHPLGDDRILDLADPNTSMSTGESDLWGYDPGVTRRYGELLALTQDVSPDVATQELPFHDVRDIYATLLRCRCAFGYERGPENIASTHFYTDAEVGAHAMLVPDVRVIPAGRDVLRAMVPPFDPRQIVLLQTAPDPAPAEHPVGGKVRIVAQTTDSLTLEAELPAAQVLVVTDAYSDGWRARSVLPAGEASPQARYLVLPADYCVRGIPLAAGHHRILLEYWPRAFVVGAWVSGLSLAACLVAAGWLWRRREAAA